MKIFKEDADVLIFEEHPLFMRANKIQINITLLISYIYALITTFFLEINALFVIVFGLITYAINYLIIKKIISANNGYSIKIRVDKKANKLSIKIKNSLWTRLVMWKALSSLSPNGNPFEIPEITISQIKNIKYVTWGFWLLNIKGGQLQFILDDHTKVNVYTPQANTSSLESYENIGRKVADFIDVPFEMQ